MHSFRYYKTKAVRAAIRLVAVINPKFANDIRYFWLFKKKIDRENPQTFAEHIIVKMESPEMELLADYADKYKVRDYVTDAIGEEYLIPLIAVYDLPRQVDYEAIPEGAYLKLNHGSGYNYEFYKKRKLTAKAHVWWWFKRNFYKIGREMQYKNIEKKILVQKNIAPKDGILWEYIFYTFEGRIEFAQIRNTKGNEIYEMDREYQPLPFKKTASQLTLIQESDNFGKMVELAERLAEPFNFVRVDFLYADGQIYFSELTFTPTAGRVSFAPEEYNLIFGEKLAAWDKSIFREGKDE